MGFVLCEPAGDLVQFCLEDSESHSAAFLGVKREELWGSFCRWRLVGWPAELLAEVHKTRRADPAGPCFTSSFPALGCVREREAAMTEEELRRTEGLLESGVTPPGLSHF